MTPVSGLPLRHAFGGIDWFMLVAYAGAVLGVGFYYARRQRTTEEYFLGGRSTHPFLAGISYFTATTSIITYIGTPGEYVQYGPGLVFFAALPALPIVQILVGRYLSPFLMRLPITSAYELLESRLGMSVRKTGSLTYMITRFVWMALILFTCSTVMVNVTGCDPRWGYVFAIATGAITTTYTLFGGLKAVMITEVIQFFMLVLGAVLTLILITVRLGGFRAWLPSHAEAHWQPQPVFGLDFHIRAILWVAFTYNVIALVCTAGSDQSAIQRLLTTRDAPAARRAYLLNNLANAGVTVLLGLVGAALIAFYRTNPQAAPGLTLARNGDAFFPYFISHELPRGISGLVVASLLAMAMSCLSAGINALITIITKDFIETRLNRPKPTQKAELKMTRVLAIIIGTAVVLGSIAVGHVSGNIYEVAGKTVNLLGCPLFGLFFLAMFVKSATPFGAIMGAVFSAASAVMVGYWDVLTGRPEMSFNWIGPVSFVVSLAAGCLFSLLPTRGRSKGVLVGYSAGSLGLLALLIGILVTNYR